MSGSLAAGSPGDCYSLSAPSGHVLYVYAGPFDQQVDISVFDAAGNLVCDQMTGICPLTGTGPYRVLASGFSQAQSYEFQIVDVTDPVGCVSVAQQNFGDLPPPSAALCSSLTVTAAGSYQVYDSDSQFFTEPGTLYAADGSQACPGAGLTCPLTPGTYSFVQDGLSGQQISTVFVDVTGGSGCPSAGDTSFASGDATGSFTGPGEELCRTLPTKSGLSDYLYSQPVSSGTQGEVLGVVDSTGAQMCPDAFSTWVFATCALTGTAPFLVILVPTNTNSSFRLLVQRTDSTAGCAAWKRSGYGNTAGAHASLTTTGNAKCFVIPAARRSATELVEECRFHRRRPGRRRGDGFVRPTAVRGTQRLSDRLDDLRLQARGHLHRDPHRRPPPAVAGHLQPGPAGPHRHRRLLEPGFHHARRPRHQLHARLEHRRALLPGQRRQGGQAHVRPQELGPV